MFENIKKIISLNFVMVLSEFYKYKNSMDVITADGGFDFSVDFNNQEQLAFRLILTQVFM